MKLSLYTRRISCVADTKLPSITIMCIGRSQGMIFNKNWYRQWILLIIKHAVSFLYSTYCHIQRFIYSLITRRGISSSPFCALFRWNEASSTGRGECLKASWKTGNFRCSKPLDTIILRLNYGVFAQCALCAVVMFLVPIGQFFWSMNKLFYLSSWMKLWELLCCS